MLASANWVFKDRRKARKCHPRLWPCRRVAPRSGVGRPAFALRMGLAALPHCSAVCAPGPGPGQKQAKTGDRQCARGEPRHGLPGPGHREEHHRRVAGSCRRSRQQPRKHGKHQEVERQPVKHKAGRGKGFCGLHDVGGCFVRRLSPGQASVCELVERGRLRSDSKTLPLTRAVPAVKPSARSQPVREASHPRPDGADQLGKRGSKDTLSVSTPPFRSSHNRTSRIVFIARDDGPAGRKTQQFSQQGVRVPGAEVAAPRRIGTGCRKWRRAGMSWRALRSAAG